MTVLLGMGLDLIDASRDNEIALNNHSADANLTFDALALMSSIR